MLLLLAACLPESGVTPTTQPNPTVAPTTVTSTIPTDAATLYPSGMDDTARFVATVKANDKVVVDGPLLINEIASLDGVANKTITFTSRGKLTRTTRAEKRVWQVLLLRNSSNIVVNNLQIQGPNVEVCGFWSTLTGTRTWIEVGYNANYEAQHGLEVFNTNGLVVNGGNIYGVSGDGIYLAGRSKNVTLNNVSTKCTGRSSVTNVDADDVNIYGGSYDMSGFWIFNIEPFNATTVNRYHIYQPKVGYSNWQWLLSSGPYFSCLITDVLVDKPIFASPQRPVKINPCVASQIKINF